MNVHFNGDIYNVDEDCWDGAYDNECRPHGPGVLAIIIDFGASPDDDEEPLTLTDIYHCVLNHGVMCGPIFVELDSGDTRYATCDENGLLHGKCTTVSGGMVLSVDYFDRGGLVLGRPAYIPVCYTHIIIALHC